MGVLLMVPALGLFEVGLTFARSASLHSPPPTPPPPSPPLPSLSHTAAPQAGLLRAKNSVSVLIQCFAGVAVLTVLWFVIGFSLCFSQVDRGLFGAPLLTSLAIPWRFLP